MKGWPRRQPSGEWILGKAYRALFSLTVCTTLDTPIGLFVWIFTTCRKDVANLEGIL